MYVMKICGVGSESFRADTREASWRYSKILRTHQKNV